MTADRVDDDLWWRNPWVWVRFVLWVAALVWLIVLVIQFATIDNPPIRISPGACGRGGGVWDSALDECQH